MKTKIISLLVFLTLIISIFSLYIVYNGQSSGRSVNNGRNTIYAETNSENKPSTLTTYVTRPITDDRILPDTVLSSSLISNKISLQGTPGEIKPATFTMNTSTNLSGLTFDVSNLTGIAGTIPGSAIDIRVVKCWLQDAGNTDNPLKLSGHKMLVPELLLKDDTLVKVENNENYLKMIDGTYRWISDPTIHDQIYIPTPSDLPVQDSPTLQPVDLTAGQNKQFWILVRIPQTAKSGVYSGIISLKNSSGELTEIHLQLEVLPFTLSPSMLEYDLYYFGESSPLYPDGSISHQYKSDQQLETEFRNMVDHGIYNVSLGAYNHDIRDWYNLGKVLAVKNAIGMTNRPLYYNWLGNDNYNGELDWETTDPSMLEDIKQAVQDVITFAKQYGVTSVYAYGLDEVYNSAEILKFKPSFRAVHDAGGKVYIAGSESDGNYFNLLGNNVDLMVNYKLDARAAKKWQSIGVPIFCYGNPQVGAEIPGTYRRNYGLLLWQSGYNGTMDYAYQSQGGAIWNDFDFPTEKDHVFAYPTMNGVIDTLEWEGWREAVTDIRYLTTLLHKIKIAKAQGKDTSLTEKWVADLKNTDLSNQDLDVIRSEIIDHIMSLIIPPAVKTNPASNVTTDKATINGNLSNTGSADNVSVSFEYGTTSRYGNTLAGIPSSLNNPGNCTVCITGLTSGTLYHYRAKAVGDGIAYSGDKTFTTPRENWWSRLWKWFDQFFNASYATGKSFCKLVK